MATSRVEKFKEYRKSIINSDNGPLKATIDSEIKISAPIEGTTLNEQEAIFLRKILNHEKAINISYFVLLILAITTLVVFGIILF